jgi:Leucine-rich repeat (LRR) protein
MTYALRDSGLAALVLALATAPALASERRGKDLGAVERIEKLGGSVFIAKTPAGETVAYVGISGRWKGGAAGLDYLKGLTNLEVLWLYDSHITDEYLAHLSGLATIRTLDIVRTRITDAGFTWLKTLPNLTELTLRGSPVTGQGLRQLQGLAQLRYLDLSDTRISDAGTPSLGSLSQLTNLFLTNTSVGDPGLVSLEGLTGLTRLGLAGTKITDAGLKHLKRMTRLSQLFLTDTAVTADGTQILQSWLPDLRRIFR